MKIMENKLDIDSKCARILSRYLNKLRELEIWHYENVKRQKATDLESYYSARLRLITFLQCEVESNLSKEETKYD